MNTLVEGLNILKVDPQFIGVPYKEDGKSLEGTDCCGLSCLFLKEQGIEIKTEDYQNEIKELVHKGKIIYDTKEVRPLDLIFFEVEDQLHVGVYIGYDKFLHVNALTNSVIDYLYQIRKTHFKFAVRVTDLIYNNEKEYNEVKDKKIGFIATVAAAVTAAVTSFATGAAVTAAIAAGTASFLTVATFYAIATVITVAVSFAVSAISAALAPKASKPDFGSGGAAAGSPHYGFGPLQNTATSELPVAVIYGENKMAGNAIYQSEPAEQVYRCDTLSEGEINSITTVEVNNIPIAELEGCSYTAYTGTTTQTVDSRFSARVSGLRNIAYLALTLKTSDKLKGGFPTVTCIVQGQKVRTWDGLQWVSAKTYSDNPAACIRDFLTDIRYGVGLPENLIDDTSFGEVYDTCNIMVSNNQGSTEKRYTLNYVADTKKPAIDILADMLITCNGYLIWSGSKLKLKTEKVENVVQNFTMSNIVEGSFSYQYSPKDEMINRVKMQYIDPNQGYTKVYALAEDKTEQDERAAIEGSNGVVEREFTMLGITRFTQASRIANTYLKGAKANPILCKFKAGIYAIHCEPGDVITVSHDVPSLTNKPFRVYTMSEEENDEISIVCKEYNDTVFDDSYGSSVTSYVYGAPPNPLAPPNPPTSVIATESGVIAQSGQYVTILTCSWTAPVNSNYIQSYIVEYAKNGGDYVSLGTTTGLSLPLYNAEETSTYVFRVKSTNYYGLNSTPAYSISYSVSGKSAPPSNVLTFNVSISIDAFLFTWDEVSDIDLGGYEIREGSSWDTGTVFLQNLTGNRVLYRPVTVGSHTFRIKAIDTSGNYSTTEATDTIVVTTAPDSNVVVTEYLWSRLGELPNQNRGTFEGELSFEPLNRYNSAYNRMGFCIRTNQTFGELEDTLKTYATLQSESLLIGEPLVTGSNGTYTTDVFDLGSIFNALTTLEVSTENTAAGTFTKQISTSSDGITWSAFATHSNTEYLTLRYYKLRFILNTSSSTGNIFFYDATFTVDVPDLMATDGGNGVSIEATGTVVNYQRTFTVPPRSLVVSTINETSNITPVITNQTVTGFTCTLYNSSNVAVAGKINYWAKGYVWLLLWLLGGTLFNVSFTWL